jgi:Polyketide cyclase / dehydrase and lipid transport
MTETHATFKPTHETRSYTHSVEATPDAVFPLLCPVREYEWIPVWDCRMVHSDSGVAELGCIFTTSLPHTGEAIWTVSRYESPRRIEFVIVGGQSQVERLAVSVEPAGADRSTLSWTRTYTGLDERGNAFIEQLTAGPLDQRMEALMRLLEHFCRTGEMLRAE